jgi:alpha-1,2-mannosyltransferase
MLLGQMVAISVALALFLTALSLRPATRPTPYCPPSLYLPLLAAMATIFAVPTFVQTEHFLANLLVMHGLLIVPLISWSKSDTVAKRRTFDLNPTVLYSALIGLAVVIHSMNASEVINTASSNTSIIRQLYNQIFSHSAQASISLDVVWVAIILAFWWMTTGSLIAVVLKIATLGTAAGLGVLSFTGVNWKLVASIVPILLLLAFGLVLLGFNQLRKRNVKRRRALLDKLKILDNEVIAGTDKKPPTKSSVKTMVGFFHPYWYVHSARQALWLISVIREEAESEYSGQLSPTSNELSRM